MWMILFSSSYLLCTTTIALQIGGVVNAAASSSSSTHAFLPTKKTKNGSFLAAENSSTGGSSSADLMIEDAMREVQKLEDFYTERQNRSGNKNGNNGDDDDKNNNNNDEFSSRDDEKFLPSIVSSNNNAAQTIIRDNTIDTIMFDCDGVLYRTTDACPGAATCITNLLTSHKRVLFVTNNAGVNRRQLKDKLSKLLGIPSLLTNDMMISSSYAAAQYLKQYFEEEETNTRRRRRVHVIGSAGLCEELQTAGFDITGGPTTTSTTTASMERTELADYDFPEHPIDAIAVGHDTEFTFRKLCIANNLLLKNPNAILVATNEDSYDLVCGSEHGDIRHIPGNGCVVKALEYCSKRNAINVGKPSKILFDIIMKEQKQECNNCLFVGDRLDTDVQFGNENGMKSLLVMTGVTTAQTLIDMIETKDDDDDNEEDPLLPHYIIPHVGMLF